MGLKSFGFNPFCHHCATEVPYRARGIDERKCIWYNVYITFMFASSKNS